MTPTPMAADVSTQLGDFLVKLTRVAWPDRLSPMEDAAWRAGVEDERARWVAALDGAREELLDVATDPDTATNGPAKDDAMEVVARFVEHLEKLVAA